MHALTKRKAIVPPEVVKFMRLPGLGPKTARRIWQELGVTTLDELRAAAEAERLRALAGLGAKTRGEDPEGARGGGRSPARAAARCSAAALPRLLERRRGAARASGRGARSRRRARRAAGARRSATST